MAEHERNFRTHFYEKVGFRTVEEKKSIEILLKEQPIKKDKLIQFSLRFGIPAMYRTYVWKIILGILPVYLSSQDFVWSHRVEQVRELQRAVVLLSPESVDCLQEHTILRMKLIQEGRLPMQNKFVDQDPDNQYFLSIVQAVCSLVSSEVDLFWISTRFYRYISQSLYANLHLFPEHTMQCLRSEEQGQKLYTHLAQHHVISDLPLMDWFHTCFANILADTSLERIWDRILGGSSYILVYVAVAIFLILRRPLLAMQSAEDMISYLKQIPEDCGDRIVNEAIDLMHRYSGQIPKPESPGSESGRNSTKSVTDSRRNSGSLKPSRRGSFDNAVSGEKLARNLNDGKSVTIEIARKSPGSSDKPGS
ncbi:unnamed protein product [Candidula unifasciata]|uniref:TBC1 domain family member 7 n=1 Tax=Candidula unifasciata TaxID=100452 RepID=A0A8S3ZRA2_9EUPU|nr:unnamed protein product [Candidula unifasciata]